MLDFVRPEQQADDSQGPQLIKEYGHQFALLDWEFGDSPTPYQPDIDDDEPVEKEEPVEDKPEEKEKVEEQEEKP